MPLELIVTKPPMEPVPLSVPPLLTTAPPAIEPVTLTVPALTVVSPLIRVRTGERKRAGADLRKHSACKNAVDDRTGDGGARVAISRREQRAIEHERSGAFNRADLRATVGALVAEIKRTAGIGNQPAVSPVVPLLKPTILRPPPPVPPLAVIVAFPACALFMNETRAPTCARWPFRRRRRL